MKRDLSNHVLLWDSKFLGNERLNGFALYSLGLFPAAVYDADENNSIMVEIYEIDQHTLTRLDMLEGHTGNPKTSMYYRDKVETRFGEVWMYIYQRPVSGKSMVRNGWW